MKTKIVAQFGLSLCLSLSSLLVVAVPTVHAMPTGQVSRLEALFSNPLITMTVTVSASLLTILIARRYDRVNAKR